MKIYFTYEQIVNGGTLTWYYHGEKIVEYYPTNESAIQRINDFFTAEKENLEIIPLKSVKVEF